MISRDLQLKKIVGSVLQSRPDSWSICAPPGCDGSGFLTALRDRLDELRKGENPSIRVASISVDLIKDESEFVRRVAIQWLKQGEESVSSGQFSAPAEALEAMAMRLSEQGKTPILLVDRFHHAAEFLTSAMLGTLRDLEVRRRVASVTVATVGYKSLRERMREQGPAFATSDYGDQHISEFVGALSKEECNQLFIQRGLDLSLVDGAIALTGALPDLMHKTIALLTSGAPDDEVVSGLLLEKVLSRFLYWISPRKSNQVSAWVASVYLNLEDSAECISRLRQHEWRHILVDSQGGLIADIIGMAALRHLGEEAKGPAIIDALRLYDAAAYREATTIVRAHGIADPPCFTKAAEVMSGASESLLNVDLNSEWDRIAQSAKDGANLCGDDPYYHSTRLAFERWDGVATSMSVLKTCASVDQQIATLLSGADPERSARRLAQFLALRMIAAQRQKSPTLAVLLMQCVPESTLTAWAHLKLGVEAGLGLDFAKEPLHSKCEFWWGRPGFKRPDYLTRPSLALLSVAVGCHQEDLLPQEGWFFPEPELRDSECRIVADLRNPTAHFAFVCNQTMRQEIQKISNAWLSRLACQCAGFRSLEELYRQLDPIPLPRRARGRWS